MDIFTIIILVVIFLAVVVAFYVLVFGKKRRLTESDQKYLKKEWNRIYFESKDHPNAAILEADKLLDHALGCYGYHGNLGEKLKAGKNLFRNINDVWSAHKIRNRIAHEIGTKINHTECKSIIAKFAAALRDLGVKI